ncbi:ralBP1-associated Eps domain-containing protein 1 isoform X2 [Nematostella vectensis]|uniref:ralBP1-associated Eps domain-containing protein 1 isoform X2 n=1 Tax=Nematostella vectensis TaxID=45351 RepID=UPI00207799A7|nr:ralBP1-associated Eps domain-containing protein 1 isoform X2 [Nematostella vectensis]
MSRKHSTLLKEEVDDDESNGDDKSKRESTQEGDKRRKGKKGERLEGYYNSSMNNSKVKPVVGAAINPSADGITSPNHTQPTQVLPTIQPPPTHPYRQQGPAGPPVTCQAQQGSTAQQVTPQGQQGYSGVVMPVAINQPIQQVYQPNHPQHIPPQNPVATHWQQQQPLPVRLPPPPGPAQHPVVAPQQYQATPQHPQAQYQPYQPHPPQGYFPGVHYTHGVPGQVPGAIGAPYIHQPRHPQHVLVRSQSLPEEPVPQGRGPPPAPQSPPGRGPPQDQQMWVAHQPPPQPQDQVEGNWVGESNGAASQQTWVPGSTATQHPMESYWAAFSGSPPTPEKPQQWDDSSDHSDHSSSDEELDRSSSPVLCGEEGEGLLRAPSLTSFAESTSSVEDEGEEDVWVIQHEQRDYYATQFRKLQPGEDGVIKGPKARDFFLKSNLPTETLSKIWHLSDINKDNALHLEEFCIAMHLVVAIRHGLDLPPTLPPTLLNFRASEEEEDPFNVSMTAAPTSPRQKENSVGEHIEASIEEQSHSPRSASLKREHNRRQDLSRPRSLSDPNYTEEPHDHSRKISSPVPPTSGTTQPEGASAIVPPLPLSPGPHIGIERPRASAKISLLDSAPGQLLPPPSGKFAREAIKESDSDSDTSDSSPPTSPTQQSPLETTPVLPLPEKVTPEPGTTTPPSPPPDSPKSVAPPALRSTAEKVVMRQQRKSGERPRSAGDVNHIVPMDDSTPGSTTPSDGSQGSHGQKDPPPPPPPRNKRGHSRSSSLDLNKLFAAKAKEAKENRAASTSSPTSSHSSQNSETVLAERPDTSQKHEPKGGASEETPRSPVQASEEQNFADFSRFDSFVNAQSSDGTSSGQSMVRSHRRSQSLDQNLDFIPKQPRKNTFEGSTSPRGNQEALPRPVPRVKPASPPPVKLTIRRPDRSSEKDKEKERKLNTEPPKVVVKPLTKESKLQTSIRDLKEKNLALSRLNSELQQEVKQVMEWRIALELKLERLKPFNPK